MGLRINHLYQPPKKLNRHYLTTRQIHVLKKMKEEDGDIVTDNGQAWVGDEVTSYALVYSLLRLAVISSDGFHDHDKSQRYEINGDGESAIKDGFIDRQW